MFLKCLNATLLHSAVFFYNRNIFTRTIRHNYVDPDYAYTDEEAEAVRQHKQYYSDFIEDLRERRRLKMQNKYEYILDPSPLAKLAC